MPSEKRVAWPIHDVIAPMATPNRAISAASAAGERVRPPGDASATPDAIRDIVDRLGQARAEMADAWRARFASATENQVVVFNGGAQLPDATDIERFEAQFLERAPAACGLACLQCKLDQGAEARAWCRFRRRRGGVQVPINFDSTSHRHTASTAVRVITLHATRLPPLIRDPVLETPV